MGLDYAVRRRGPADHGAVAARHLHPPCTRAARAPTSSSMCSRCPSLDKFGDPLHRFFRHYGERVQPAADLARHRAHPFRQGWTKRRRSRRTICRPTKTASGRGRRDLHHAAVDEARRHWRSIIRSSSCPPLRSATTTPSLAGRPPATSAPPSSTPSAPRRWAGPTTPTPWSTSACIFALRACASPMPRSCRRSPRQYQHADSDDRREGPVNDPLEDARPREPLLEFGRPVTVALRAPASSRSSTTSSSSITNENPYLPPSPHALAADSGSHRSASPLSRSARHRSARDHRDLPRQRRAG